MSEVEQILLQHTIDRSAAGNIRQVASRTRDVIEAVIRVAVFSGRSVDSGLNSDDLGLRLEFGLPEDIVPLAQLVGTVLNRGEYLALRSIGVLDANHAVACGLEGLMPAIGQVASEKLLALIAGL
jgi:helicase